AFSMLLPFSCISALTSKISSFIFLFDVIRESKKLFYVSVNFVLHLIRKEMILDCNESDIVIRLPERLDKHDFSVVVIAVEIGKIERRNFVVEHIRHSWSSFSRKLCIFK